MGSRTGFDDLFVPYRDSNSDPSIVHPVSIGYTECTGSPEQVLLCAISNLISFVDWIGLAQDRYRWRALVNSVMNDLRFSRR
jgi:hypothetical protein